jgi:integrase
MTAAAPAYTDPLDPLAGLLPIARRDHLAGLLSAADLATLRHLAKAGRGPNTLRAFASDLAYLERWALAATSGPLPWPAPATLIAKFIAHHLWDAAKKDSDPDHGMPATIAAELFAQGALRSAGPHAPATVRRRLALWSSMHKARGLEAPFADPRIRAALRLAVRACPRPRARKSQRAVTADIVKKLLATCRGERPQDIRDRALILVAFASGGRRRSEVAALRVEDILVEADVPADPRDPSSPRLPCRRLRLGRTKTADAQDDAEAFLIGRPVEALDAWLKLAGIVSGRVFRRIDQWENILPDPLTGQGVNLVLKRRIAQAGLDPALYSAHGLRSGYLTEAARQGVPLPEAMAQSQHKSLQQAARYYNHAERRMGKAARLLG